MSGGSKPSAGSCSATAGPASASPRPVHPSGPISTCSPTSTAALEIAAACNLRIIFVLLDFLWFGKAALFNGVQVRGRGGVISSAYKQRALRRRVLKPLLKRYGRSPVILAWDIVNEPEWATRGCGGVSDTALPYLTMRRFIKKTARLIHRYTKQLATVGLGNAADCPWSEIPASTSIRCTGTTGGMPRLPWTGRCRSGTSTVPCSWANSRPGIQPAPWKRSSKHPRRAVIAAPWPGQYWAQIAPRTLTWTAKRPKNCE